jgi:ABC-2 type transport system permease protein
MNWTVLTAIFKRDFVSYFSNPTGYVFICVFVMLSALAAFWPPDFFSNNLANLDQLNRWLPFILLVFVPAITMSIWAEERRQGTDELLLTLPASDLEVVLGKYSAAVAIYTVALLFSMFSIYLVFSYGLGTPDPGLFVGTYVGYWFVGLAMLSIGMVASFLTSNLTVGFVMGMIFNLPLALFGVADWFIKWPGLASAIKQWSAAEQFRDFERGVISLAGVSYFLMITAVMLYLSMVLIGRRHWGGREEKESMWAHYLARTLGLVALALGLNLFLANHNSIRADITSENLNSLAPRTVRLIKDLAADDKVKTIKIDAYVSPQVPAEYAPHKLNFLSTLAELRSLSGGKILVDVHEVEIFSEQAAYAEQQAGIKPQEVDIIDRGARRKEEIILGAVFYSGLERVQLPFIDKGLPIEYELVRSICTVAGQQRKRLGVLKTDAQLFGGFSMQGMTQESPLINELKKQYNVVEVDPASPIKERYDALLAVQPSSLSPEAMVNFVDAVKDGQPTAIFEDPFPIPNFNPEVVGTAQPKRPPGGMMFGGMPPQPKGDISQLWQLLGVEMRGDEIIWQDFNPEPKAGDFVDPEWIFIDRGLEATGTRPFNPDNGISAGMNQVLFLLAGSFRPADRSKLEFTELAVTGQDSGMINYSDYEMSQRSRGMLNPRRAMTQENYVVAAQVTGKVVNEDELLLSDEKNAEKKGQDADKNAKDAKEEEADPLVGKELTKTDVNVVLVADIDWIAPVIFMLRERGNTEDMPIDWKFQNVTFVLNILDTLAGDDRFVEIRKRTRPHRILTKIDEATEASRERTLKQQQEFINEAKEQIAAAQQSYQEKIEKVRNQPGVDPRIIEQQVDMLSQTEQRKLDVQIETLNKDRNAKIKQSERELSAEIRGVQDTYKLLAVALPPIPPILLALMVFFHRRKAEQEGVVASRLRFGKAKESESKESSKSQ